MSVEPSEGFVDGSANCLDTYFAEIGVFARVAFASTEFLLVGERLVDIEGCREA